MQLVLRRSQRSAILGGKQIFVLEVRASLSKEELGNIAKYRLGDTLLYSRDIIVEGTGILGYVSKKALDAMNISVSVDDLTRGKKVECKDIMEMMFVVEQIKTAAQNFKAVLESAAHFGGEEILEI